MLKKTQKDTSKNARKIPGIGLYITIRKFNFWEGECMGIKWDDIKVGSSLLTNRIYIGKAKKDKHGLEIWMDKSGDMTDKFIIAVKQHLQQRCQDEEEFKDGIRLNFKDGTLSFEPKKEGEDNANNSI